MRIRNWLLSVFNAIRIRPNRRRRRGNLRRMLATAALTPLLVANSYADEPLFPGRVFPTGSRPWSVATGDFNGDGVIDLATANANSDDVSVLLALGDGSFAEQARYPAGTAPRSITAGDFNGDGVIDLATANEDSGDVSVMLGMSDGTFGAQATFPIGASPYSVTTGDFNGDGVADLATANEGSDNVSVLLGLGSVSFTAPAGPSWREILTATA